MGRHILQSTRKCKRLPVERTAQQDTAEEPLQPIFAPPAAQTNPRSRTVSTKPGGLAAVAWRLQRACGNRAVSRAVERVRQDRTVGNEPVQRLAAAAEEENPHTKTLKELQQMTGKARSYFEYIAQAVKYYRKYQQPLPENVSKAARKLQDYCKRISEHFETLEDAIGDVDTILKWSESLYDFGDATLKLVESPFNINDWIDALGAVNELCGLANNWATEIALKGSPVAARLSFLTAYVGAMLTIANQVIPWFKNVMEERHRAFERAAAGAEPKPREAEPVYPGD